MLGVLLARLADRRPIGFKHLRALDSLNAEGGRNTESRFALPLSLRPQIRGKVLSLLRGREPSKDARASNLSIDYPNGLTASLFSYMNTGPCKPSIFVLV